MEINVKMSAGEFLEFMDWKAAKEVYAKEVVRLRRVPNMIAASLRHAVQPIEGKTGKFKIVDHEHMGDVLGMVEEFMPKE